MYLKFILKSIEIQQMSQRGSTMGAILQDAHADEKETIPMAALNLPNCEQFFAYGAESTRFQP